MTFQQELASWKSPTPVKTAPAPSVGSKAPSSTTLKLPSSDGKPTIITFLRHCGCPFAEKTFLEFRRLAGKHQDVNFIAVSHSDQAATDKWVIDVGGEWDVAVMVDTERELYGEWGLGVSSAWHVLNPLSLFSVYQVGKKDKIWNRPTESGSRWQTAGSFAIDKDGTVKWSKVASASDDIPDFKEALATIGVTV